MLIFCNFFVLQINLELNILIFCLWEKILCIIYLIVDVSFICKKYFKIIIFVKKVYVFFYFVFNIVLVKMFFFILMLIVINVWFEIVYIKMYEEFFLQEFKDCFNMILFNSDFKWDLVYIIDYVCVNKFFIFILNKRWVLEKDEEEFIFIINKINKLDIYISFENVRYEKRSI